MTTTRKAEYFGTCSNCGQVFKPHGAHGEGCGCGYALSAHEPNCWGLDGRTPHPLNPALAPEELAHRRKAAVLKAKATKQGAA